MRKLSRASPPLKNFPRERIGIKKKIDNGSKYAFFFFKTVKIDNLTDAVGEEADDTHKEHKHAHTDEIEVDVGKTFVNE